MVSTTFQSGQFEILGYSRRRSTVELPQTRARHLRFLDPYSETVTRSQRSGYFTLFEPRVSEYDSLLISCLYYLCDGRQRDRDGRRGRLSGISVRNIGKTRELRETFRLLSRLCVCVCLCVFKRCVLTVSSTYRFPFGVSNQMFRDGSP